MESSVVTWLAGFGSAVFRICAVLFVLLNVAAAAAYLTTRSRTLVQKWTGPWLAANFLLVGAGAGIPVVTTVVKAAVSLVVQPSPQAQDWRAEQQQASARDR